MRSDPNGDRYFEVTFAQILNRLDRVERWIAAQAHPDIDFSEPGAISTGTWPPKAFPAGAGYVLGMVVLLGTAGTSTSTFQLRKNGTAVTGSPVSLSSGTTQSSVTLSAPGTAFVGPYSDILVPEITAAGTGAKDASVFIQWRPAV